MNRIGKFTKGIKLFAGRSNQPLAQKIAKHLDVELSDIVLDKFSDGECSVKINETVRGYDIFIIQSTSNPVNDNLMELLIIIDALKRASAGRITAVIPYFGYARQDMVYKPRDPISARLVSDLIVTAGADRVLTLDIHTSQIQGFFSCPMDNMRGNPLLVGYYKKIMADKDGDFIAVAPNEGAVKRNRLLAERLNIPLAVLDNRYDKNEGKGTANVIGNVTGKHVIMVDDMINTGDTMISGANAVMAAGALSVSACCSHPVFMNDALDKVLASPVEELVVMDTIDREDKKDREGLTILSTSAILASAIDSVHDNKSISRLYDSIECAWEYQES